MNFKEILNNPEGREELMIPPDGVKRKLGGVFHLTRVVKCLMES